MRTKMILLIYAGNPPDGFTMVNSPGMPLSCSSPLVHEHEHHPQCRQHTVSDLVLLSQEVCKTLFRNEQYRGFGFYTSWTAQSYHFVLLDNETYDDPFMVCERDADWGSGPVVSTKGNNLVNHYNNINTGIDAPRAAREQNENTWPPAEEIFGKSTGDEEKSKPGSPRRFSEEGTCTDEVWTPSCSADWSRSPMDTGRVNTSNKGYAEKKISRKIKKPSASNKVASGIPKTEASDNGNGQDMARPNNHRKRNLFARTRFAGHDNLVVSDAKPEPARRNNEAPAVTGSWKDYSWDSKNRFKVKPDGSTAVGINAARHTKPEKRDSWLSEESTSTAVSTPSILAQTSSGTVLVPGADWVNDKAVTYWQAPGADW